MDAKKVIIENNMPLHFHSLVIESTNYCNGKM